MTSPFTAGDPKNGGWRQSSHRAYLYEKKTDTAKALFPVRYNRIWGVLPNHAIPKSRPPIARIHPKAASPSTASQSPTPVNRIFSASDNGTGKSGLRTRDAYNEPSPTNGQFRARKTASHPSQATMGVALSNPPPIPNSLSARPADSAAPASAGPNRGRHRNL